MVETVTEERTSALITKLASEYVESQAFAEWHGLSSDQTLRHYFEGRADGYMDAARWAGSIDQFKAEVARIRSERGIKAAR